MKTYRAIEAMVIPVGGEPETALLVSDEGGSFRSAVERVLGGEPCTVSEDADAMRLRLIFEGKPSEECRTALKSADFRWAPSQGAWQRQLTDNDRRALRRIEAV